jgi:hypothetical protein
MRTLFVANGGGHLEELWQLRNRIATLDVPRTWVTFDTEQTRSLLTGEE